MKLPRRRIETKLRNRVFKAIYRDLGDRFVPPTLHVTAVQTSLESDGSVTVDVVLKGWKSR